MNLNLSNIPIIDSILHPWVQHASRLARNRKYRHLEGRLLIGGHKIVTEYLQTNQPFKVGITDEYAQRYSINSNDYVKLSRKCIEYVTREPAPEGIIAEVPFFERSMKDLISDKVLVLLNTSLPGNLGVLLRSSLAFGFNTVFMVGNSVDYYSYEVIRCSKGASLYSDIRRINSIEDLPLLIPDHQILIATMPNQSTAKDNLTPGITISNSTDPQQPHLKSKLALILGNESNGTSCIPQDIIKRSNLVSIGISHLTESLNVGVAGSILMHSISFWRSP